MATLHAGLGGAARDFCNRHRIPLLTAVLSLVGIATGTATAMALLQDLSFVGPLLIGAGALLAGACAFAQTRHVGLALTAAGAPLPGLIWAAPLSSGSAFGALPAAAYAFAFAIAALEVESTVDRALGYANAEHPWRAGAAAIAVTLVLALLWFGGGDLKHAAQQALFDVALAALSTAVLTPLVASLLHYDESFVARINRTRERRRRIFEHIARVAEPRWAMSLAGVALVFLALGWFGAASVMRQEEGAVALRVISVAAVALAAGLLLRSWREGLATGFAVTAAGLVGLWAAAEGARDPSGPVWVAIAAPLAFLLAIFGERCCRRYEKQNEPHAAAMQRGIEQISAGQVFAAAGAMAATLPAALAWPSALPLAAGVLAAGVGGIVWAPAASGALEALLPHRRSADALYASRRKNHA